MPAVGPTVGLGVLYQFSPISLTQFQVEIQVIKVGFTAFPDISTFKCLEHNHKDFGAYLHSHRRVYRP
jgi:hypothetical protein